MTTPTFREPTSATATWGYVYTIDGEHYFVVHDPMDDAASIMLLPDSAHELLEMLLDICPNAEAIAHNFLLERQKAEHMKGGGS